MGEGKSPGSILNLCTYDHNWNLVAGSFSLFFKYCQVLENVWKLNYIPYIPCLIESSRCVPVSYILLKYSILFSYLKSLSVKGKLTENSFPGDRVSSHTGLFTCFTMWLAASAFLPSLVFVNKHSEMWFLIIWLCFQLKKQMKVFPSFLVSF